MKQLLLFSKYKILTLRHSIENITISRSFKAGIFILLGLIFMIIDFFFFWRITSKIIGMTYLGKLRFSFIINLLNMVFILFMGLVLFSNIITALSTFFLSRDLTLLISTPIKFITLYVNKFFQTFINSSWMVILFGFPIFIAYGLTLKASIWYYFLLIIIIIPFLLIPTALGSMLTMSLMRFFPAKQTHQLIASLSLIFGAGLVVVIRLIKPENFVKPISPERLEYYDKLLRIPSSPYLPSTWATESIMNVSQGKWHLFQENILLLWVVALALCYFSFLLARSIYFSAYSRSQSGSDGDLKRIIKPSQHSWERILNFLKPQFTAFIIKDIKTFLREITQWSQILLLLAIVFIYLYNIKNLNIITWYLSNFYAFLNVGMAGFVLSALCARFVFPSISQEGQAYWILQNAPLNYRYFILEKYIFYLIPLLFLGITIIIISNSFLQVDQYMNYISIFMMLCITLALIGLGVGLGSMYPRFNVENAAQIAVSTGGILYMIISMFYLLIIIILEAYPVHLHLKMIIWGDKINMAKIYPYHAIVIIISLSLTIIPPLLGLKKLKKLELK